MTGLRAVLACVALGTGSLSCAGGHASARGDDSTLVGVTSADQVPLALVLDGLDGTPVDIAQYRGRAVLVIAFLMDDLPSHSHMRHVEHVAREFGDDLVVLAVAGDRQPYRLHRDMAAIFARVNELQRTHILLADDAVRDGASGLGSIDAVPTTFLVNRAGVIARRVAGYMDYPQLRALVEPAVPRR
ncbi:MAG: hypothetical protein WCJ30_11515 [Deltaproteobacteria bacterium]